MRPDPHSTLMFDPPPKPAPPLLSRLWVQVVLTLAAACLAQLPWLGSSGLSQSEGHRAIPGWTMLERGNWIVPHLFEQPYLRKPPGMPWAVALFSSVFGENEWSARLVSATACIAMSVVALIFARRWFRPRFALAAGLAQALTPVFYIHPSGRSAEIEPLHNFFAQVVTLVLFDAIVRPGSRSRARILGVVVGLALGAMLLTKGPAALPCVIAAILAGFWARWRPKALLSPTLGIGIPLGLAIFAVWAILLARAISGLDLVTESPTEFLFRDGALGKVLALAPVSLAGAAPVSLTLIVLLLPTPRPDYLVEQRRRAKALAIACLGALLIYTALGVSNNRYAMPALGVLAPLATFWLADAHLRLSKLEARRVRMVATAILIVLIAAALPLSYLYELRRERNTGQNLALPLATILPDGAEIWGDQVVEQRPEIFWYARQEAKALGKTITPRWVPQRAGQPPKLPKPGDFFLARIDPSDSSGEWQLIRGSRDLAGVEPIWEGRVQNLVVALYQIPEPPKYD